MYMDEGLVYLNSDLISKWYEWDILKHVFGGSTRMLLWKIIFLHVFTNISYNSINSQVRITSRLLIEIISQRLWMADMFN
jgi:hypothetical protein